MASEEMVQRVVLLKFLAEYGSELDQPKLSAKFQPEMSKEHADTLAWLLSQMAFAYSEHLSESS